MATDIDIKRNSRVRLTREGYRAERTALVSGVSGTAAQVLYNAVNDAGLPNIGDVHPEISSITLQELNCQDTGGGKYLVTMSYYKDAGSVTGSSNAEARINSGLSVEESSLDIDGGVMQTTYFSSDGALVRQRFTGEVERPRITFDFEYTDTAIPTSAINTYLGKINSVAWNGYAPKTVLCSGINVDQSGADYRIRYSFAYRAGTWGFEAKTAYPPPLSIASGEPDYALDLNTGIKLFSVYRTVDFSPLGFAFATVNYTDPFDKGVYYLTGIDAALTVA